MSERIKFTIPTRTIKSAERSESHVWAVTIFDPRSDTFETLYGICSPADAVALRDGLEDGTAQIFAK